MYTNSSVTNTFFLVCRSPDDDVLIKFATPFKHQISNDSEPEFGASTFDDKSQRVECSTPDSSKELKKNLSGMLFSYLNRHGN